MTTQIPLVDYLVLGDEPHLVANQCASCGARFFDRRNACARCFGTEFTQAAVSTEGEVKAFTLVAFAAPGVPVPFAAAIIVAGRLPPGTTTVGMRVQLATFPIGVDSEGTEAVGFGFEPVA